MLGTIPVQGDSTVLPATDRRAPSVNHLALLLASLGFACVVGLVTYRAATRFVIPDHPDAVHWVMQDFRDATYFPVRSFLDGNNPYDAAAQASAYPVGQTFPPYSPLTLLLHAPLGLLPLGAAALGYFALNLVLTLGFAALVLRLTGSTSPAATLVLAALLLLSRPGQWNLMLGQPTLLIVIGVYLALFWAHQRPWLAGLGLALSSLKPTFAVPLALLMLARGEVRAVWVGSVAAGIAAAAGAVGPVLAAGGLVPFVGGLPANYAAVANDPSAHALLSIYRVDVIALAARLLGRGPRLAEELALSLTILAVGAFAMRSSRGASEPAYTLSSMVACLTLAAGTYHLAYDLLLLTLPAVALWRGGKVAPWATRPWRRQLFLALFAVLGFNYAATQAGTNHLVPNGRLWTVVTSLNSTAVLALFIGYVDLLLRRRVEKEEA